MDDDADNDVDNDTDAINDTDILPAIKVSDGENRPIIAISPCCTSASEISKRIAAKTLNGHYYI